MVSFCAISPDMPIIPAMKRENRALSIFILK
jgi:hypothetical protein